MKHLLSQTPTAAARAMLGAIVETDECRIQIVETEAYGGYDDPGSHAHRGPTPRTRVMFGEAGMSFVYFTYGNHWMLNFVCDQVGVAGAVLVRGAIPLEGHEAMRGRRLKARSDHDLLSGPGKIAAALGLTGIHDGLDLLDPRSPVRLVAGKTVDRVLCGTRIGLAPGKGDTFPWRYVDADQVKWCSRRAS